MKRSFFLFSFFLSTLCGWSQQENIRNYLVPAKASHDSVSAILQRAAAYLENDISYNADLLKEETLSIPQDSLPLGCLLGLLFNIDKPEIQLIGNQLVVYESLASPAVVDSCFQTIEIVIKDTITNSPVAKATIHELSSGRLTTTNVDGKFHLVLPCNVENPLLQVDAIGYRSKIVSRELGSQEYIFLEGDHITLKEVIISTIIPERLMKQVIAEIPRNYLQKPTKARAFFREAILKDEKLATLSEAVFDVYHSAYDGSTQVAQAQLIKGRRFYYPIHNDTIQFKVKGSLQSCFDLDAIKNPPPFLDQETFTESYEFNFQDIQEFNGQDLYVISFKRKKLARDLPYEGTLYIDKEKRRLIALNFGMEKKAIRRAGGSFIVKRKKGTKIRLLDARYHVNYTEVEERLVMNYVNLRTHFKVRKKRNFFSAKYETLSEYVVNQFDTNAVNRISKKETFSAERVFIDEPLEYRDEYWQGMNFLPIDQPLIEASEELKKIVE